MPTTYWMWVRKHSGERIDVGSRILEADLIPTLARYDNSAIYANIFYGRN